MAEPQEGAQTPNAYSPVPRKRRGNRRATGGSAFTGTEPKLAGLTPVEQGERGHAEAEDARASWLKEQRPPHYQGRV